MCVGSGTLYVITQIDVSCAFVTDFGFARCTTQCFLCADSIFPTRVPLADWKRTAFMGSIKGAKNLVISAAYRCGISVE
jgi:hypothetical protein